MSDEKTPDSSYRDRIYAKYGALFQDAKPEFNPEAARKWGRPYNSYFDRWLPSEPDASIVDLACGGGKLLQFYIDRGYTNVTGVDISPDQVGLSRQVVRNVEQSSVIDFLAARPGEFDLISGLDIVEHFRKDEVLGFLDAILRSLKPGGRVILQTPNADSPWASQHRYNDLTHELAFNPNSLGRLLSLVGFVDPQARECGPAPHSPTTLVRFLLWRGLRLSLIAWNLIEIGGKGSGIFTRIFLISARKQAV